MRLAFLTHEPFFPPSGGGSAEAVYLVPELVRRGHEVHLFCPQFDEAESVAARFGVELHQFRGFKLGRYARWRNLKYLLYPTALERLVRRVAAGVKFDAVLSQHTISAVAAGRLRSALGVPVVMNFLDCLTGFMETWPAWKMPRPLVAALTRYELSLPRRYQADGVMTVSDALADRFEAAGFQRDRTQAINYGYDPNLFRVPPPGQAPPPSIEPVIVMHGSFDQHHLGRIALAAAKRLCAARPDTEFRFVGTQTAALTGLLKEIRYAFPRARLNPTGFVPYTDVAGHLAGATLGIVPYEESRGTHCAFVAKLVECLAVGLPVASTRLEAMRRYFGDEPAVKFTEFDGEALAKAILAWIATPAAERGRLGRAAAARVSRELAWPLITAKAAAFVEQMVASSSSSRSKSD